MALLKIHNRVQAEKFTATSSAQTPLIVFSLTRKKLIASLCFLFPQKPIGLFGVPFIFRRTKSVLLLTFATIASSPKRRQWRMKRGEDGAAVKIARRSKPISDFGNRKSPKVRAPPA